MSRRAKCGMLELWIHTEKAGAKREDGGAADSGISAEVLDENRAEKKARRRMKEKYPSEGHFSMPAVLNESTTILHDRVRALVQVEGKKWEETGATVVKAFFYVAASSKLQKHRF